jgi:hypothetical protein
MPESLILTKDNIEHAASVTDYTVEELEQILAAYVKHGMSTILRIPYGKGWRNNARINGGPVDYFRDRSVP